ncbi:MAG: hypothetical protein CMQ15_16140 [Gammaproteobacteria bacterium]|jgi:radical SAM superfamily enzyme YgiQ (UPF0313 family)|nr:hypothetical protein [Gammaproteobacteria bacterium]
MDIKKNLKVLLVVPNFRWCEWNKNTLWHYIPYNFCLLASMVIDKCDVKILDANLLNLTEDDFKCELSRLKPDLVGITVLMDQYGTSGHKAAELAKSYDKETVVIMGGVYATTNSQKVMEDPNIDYAVIGEGEYVFRDFIGYCLGKNLLPVKGISYRSKGKVIHTGHSEFIKDLDALPLPAYHLIDFDKYANNAHRKSVDSPRKYPYARILTSRGCPYECVFCQVEEISGRKIRYRSSENVLEEIKWLKDKYNVQSLIFDDDNLFLNKKRANKIFQGMIDRNLVMPWVAIAVAVFALDEELIKLMRASGCEYIDIAIESGSQRVLKEIINKPVNLEQAKEMNRIARKEGIYVAANFIIGFPGETWDEIRETIKFAEDINVDYMKLFAAIPLRNTELWKLCEKEGMFRKNYGKSTAQWSSGQINTNEFTANDITILRAFEWERINFADKEKRKRTAAMLDITKEELLKIRKKTIRDVVHLISNNSKA